MYWYSTPPLLKQWEDDVLTHGWAYGSTGTALHGKELGIAVSPGAPASSYERAGEARYTVHELMRPLQATSALIGTRFLTPWQQFSVSAAQAETFLVRFHAGQQHLLYTRLDLTALDDLGRTLHIEMQRENYTHFQKRCLLR